MALLRPVLDAVGYAHSRQVVHRDLKPSNIMLSPAEGHTAVKVLDFGVAKVVEDESIPESEHSRTHGPSHAFSRSYAAPEQLAGGRTGPWTDIHALGLLLTELLTDRIPYDSSDPTELYELVFQADRPSPARYGVDVGPWQMIIERAVSLKPSKRFRDVAALAVALQQTIDEATLAFTSHPADDGRIVVGATARSLATDTTRSEVTASDTFSVVSSRRPTPSARDGERGARASPCLGWRQRRPSSQARLSSRWRFDRSGAREARRARAKRRSRPRSNCPRRIRSSLRHRRLIRRNRSRHRQARRTTLLSKRKPPRRRLPCAGPLRPRSSPRPLRHRLHPSCRRMWSSRLASSGLSSMLALALFAPRANAQEEPRGRADLIQRAQQAKASGNHAEALRLGREAGEAKMTASLRRFLVEEESALGMWVDAYSDAQKCTHEAAMEPPSPNHDAVLIGCRTLLHTLRDQVGLVVLDFPTPPPADLRVTLDGRLVDGPLAETEHPTHKGEVAVEATAPGRPSIDRVVLVGDEPIHVSLAFAEPPNEPVATSLSPGPVARTKETSSGRTVHGLSGPIVAGVGVAAGIGAVVTRAIANGEYDALQQRCPPGACRDESEARARIERLDTVALVAGVGGAALLGLGATLYFVVDKRTEHATSRRETFSVAFDPRSRVVTWSAPF